MYNIFKVLIILLKYKKILKYLCLNTLQHCPPATDSQIHEQTVQLPERCSMLDVDTRCFVYTHSCVHTQQVVLLQQVCVFYLCII